jgi:multiple sugar transport system substrate-binding protein
MISLLGAGTTAGLAGCLGGVGGGEGGDGGDGGGGGNQTGKGGDGGDGGAPDLMSAAEQIGFAENWQQRRFASLDEDGDWPAWPAEKRMAIPTGDADNEKSAWKESEAVQSAPWTPPPGWEDTPAGDVDSFEILNHGSLDFDPATLATFALFEDRTDITINPLEIVVDQAIPKKAAFFSAGEPTPHATDVVVQSSLSSFATADHIAPTRAQPDEEMWEPYIPLTQGAFTYNDTQYLGPNINQGGLVHARPQMMLDEGVSQDVVDSITGGEWDWSDLETVMETFAGGGTAGWAYRGSSLVYTFRDWQKMLYEAGGRIVQDDDKVVVNDEAHLVAVRKMREWLENGWVPDAVTSYTQGDLADGFLSGELAMVPVFGDLIPRAIDQFGDDPQEYRPVLPPAGADPAPDPSRATIASPNGVAINAYSDVGHQLAVMLYHDCRYTTASQWWEFANEGNNQYLNHVFDQAAELGTVPYAETRGTSMETAVVEVWQQQRATSQRISEQLQQIIAGNVDAQEGLDSAQQFVDTVLGQN